MSSLNLLGEDFVRINFSSTKVDALVVLFTNTDNLKEIPAFVGMTEFFALAILSLVWFFRFRLP
jgi:hypothetical protein